MFLSASIPDPNRDPKFYRSADVVAIREAIRALVAEVLPRGRLVFGGHPAISPLIDRAAGHLRVPTERVRVYQSEFFRQQIPPSTLRFVDLRWTPEVPGDREASLKGMRERMIAGEGSGADDRESSDAPVCAVFIGGMEGVVDEFALFRQRWPHKPVFPLASTGAAALELLQSHASDVQALAPPALAPTLVSRLHADLAYDLLLRAALRPLL